MHTYGKQNIPQLMYQLYDINIATNISYSEELSRQVLVSSLAALSNRLSDVTHGIVLG